MKESKSAQGEQRINSREALKMKVGVVWTCSGHIMWGGKELGVGGGPDSGSTMQRKKGMEVEFHKLHLTPR